jgi:hypothetical protein
MLLLYIGVISMTRLMIRATHTPWATLHTREEWARSRRSTPLKLDPMGGRLAIWWIPTGADDYLFTFFRKGDTEVEISIRGRDTTEAALKAYVPALKEVVRSIRFREASR